MGKEQPWRGVHSCPCQYPLGDWSVHVSSDFTGQLVALAVRVMLPANKEPYIMSNDIYDTDGKYDFDDGRCDDDNKYIVKKMTLIWKMTVMTVTMRTTIVI